MVYGIYGCIIWDIQSALAISAAKEESKMAVKIWAHRGASKQFPENTLAAFARAAELGADGIELDVSLSADGRVIVMHDNTVDRTTDGHGEIANMTWDELRKLDCGQGQRPPLLSEVLEQMRDNHLLLNMEIKSGLNPRGFDGLEDKAVALVHEFGLASRVLYSSFNHGALMRVRELDHSAPIGLLYSCQMVRDWDYAKAIGAEALHPHYASLLAPGYMQSANKAGVIVRPWTVDDPELMRRFMREGAEVITNLPDVALDVRSKL